MHTYDLMVIYKADTDTKKVEAMLREFVEPVGAKMTDFVLVGKKEFAYPINKQSEGVYVTCVLHGKVTQTGLQNSAKQHHEVVRFLLTTKE